MSIAYLSIPITGYPDKNLPAAREAAAWLTASGYTVIVPHDLPAHDHTGPCPTKAGYPGVTVQPGEPLHNGLCYLRADLRAMLDADVLVLTGAWRKSYGCNVEHDTASAVKMPIAHIQPIANTYHVMWLSDVAS